MRPRLTDRPCDRRPWRDRRGSIALMSAILAIPMIAMFGLAIDYAQLNQARSVLYLAANSAALNALKVAATAQVGGDANYVSEGVAAGNAWWSAQIGKLGSRVSNSQAQISINPGPPLSASVTVTGTAASLFGKMFGASNYSLGFTIQSVINTSPYVEVVVLLDTSSSMSIGASPSDMATLLDDSPCDPSNEFTSTDGVNYSQGSANTYGQYECSYTGTTYDGQPSCPVQSGSTTYSPANNVHTEMGPACPNKVNGHTAYAGPPCAFACHWDGSKAAGLGNDLWAMARRNGVTLRADTVKQATSGIVSALQTASQANNAFSIGIYTFNSALTRVYPSSGEAGSDWTTAAADVGAPPTSGSSTKTDTGIQPALAGLSGTNNNTNFQEAMADLATNDLTPAGYGTSPASPRKVLLLITDGMEDDSNTNARDAMPYTACQQLKGMGYNIYVIYMPYYPLMETYYLQYLTGIAEGSGASSIAYNLQQCSSSTGPSDLSTYYLVATNQAGLSAALKTFLSSVLSAPARFTQ
jgi:Flp pilus assembly protein TadG